MAQLQFRSDDTVKWLEGYGTGVDGDLTISSDTTEAPIDASCTATAGTNSISATNASFATGQIILIHKTRGSTTTAVGTWELNVIASYTAGTITTKYALQNAYQDSGADQSQVRVLKQYNNVTIDNTKTYTAKAWGGDVGGIIGWFAKGTTTFTGTLQATACGYRGDPASTGSSQQQGEGTPGDGTTAVTANGNGGGGGQNTNGGGGGGGNGAAGTNAEGTNPRGGDGGGTAGNAGLTVACFGGGGGGGSANDYVSSGTNGGGNVFIFSANITGTGYIKSTGTNSAGSGGGGCSGGAGAGGSILLKCKTATLGTNLVLASGATGGDSYYNGGNGGVGRIHIDYKTSYTGTTTPSIDARQDLTLDYIGGAKLFLFI